MMKSALASVNERIPLLAYLLLAAVSIGWASSYILIKIAVVEVPPATLATARLLVASAVLLAWLRLGENRPLPTDLRSWAGYALIALFGHALPLYLIAWASMAVPVTEMSILVATTPVFAVLFAFVARREWPPRMTVFGLLAGLFGVAAVLGQPDIPTSYTNASALPRLALLGAAASYALSGRVVARLREANAVVTVTAVMICAIPMLLPLSLGFERPWTIHPRAETVAALLLLGVMSTAVVYVAYYRLIGLSGPAFASTHHYLVPALSIALGAAFLGERLALEQIALLTPIVLSVFIARGLISQKL